MHRSRNQKGLNAHVHQSADGFRSTVGMESGKHKVPSESCLDRDFGGFEVANLAHQNCVRILTQESSKSGSEIQPDGLLHLYLVDTRKLKLDRIFRGHDVGVGFIEK